MSLLDKFRTKKQIKVSVIIPIYNTEQYLEQCLKSIEQQTLTDIEIICIDDCSTDSSLNILKNHAQKDKRIIILQNKENDGAGYSRNIGLDNAKGKYIMFVDSDDYLDLETLEYCFNKSEEQNLDLLMFKARRYDIEKKEYVEDNGLSLKVLDDYNHIIFNHEDIDSDILFKISVTPHTKLFKKSFLNFRFQEGIIFEDNPFFIKTFLTAKRVSVINKYFYHRMIRSGSVMKQQDLSILNIIDSLEETLTYLKNNPKFYDKFHKSFYEYMIHTLRNKTQVIKSEYLNEFFNYIKSFILKCIVEYDLYYDIQESLSKPFLYFYNLIILSMNSDIEKIQQIQRDLTLDIPLSIIIFCEDKTLTQINNIVYTFICQSMGFSYMKLIFITDTSISNKTSQLIHEYEKTFYNINVVKLDCIDKLNSYNSIMNYITSQYVLFYDENINYDDAFIKNIFRKSRIAQANIEQYMEYEQEHDINQLTIGSKLFKRKFLSNADNLFIEQSNPIINPYMFYKGNKPHYTKIIEILSEFVEKKGCIQKYNNTLMDTLRVSFYDTEARIKNEYFRQIKKFIHQKIIEQDLDAVFRENMSKTNKMFYDLIILSITIDDEKTRKLQENINRDNPISIICYCKDNSKLELDRTINSIVQQNIGFIILDVILVDDNSSNNETRNTIEEYTSTYTNIRSIYLDSNYGEIKSYFEGLNIADTRYVMFLNNNYSYLQGSIKNIFKAVRLVNFPAASGKVDKLLNEENNFVWTKIFQKQSLLDLNIEFREENECIIIDLDKYPQLKTTFEDIYIIKKI
ncbi:glycosyltransferase family 2 protein [Methanosphaera sp. WGK6]|uniref:glycosyltransferase family 2 protein n=1 Tax=Methanosphaera sp. WGK6 TaxID=1561964 RepID=UPI00084CD398|nr:glycosyltransferase family 2 protein [Methanosphaera sp. WGK6]